MEPWQLELAHPDLVKIGTMSFTKLSFGCVAPAASSRSVIGTVMPAFSSEWRYSDCTSCEGRRDYRELLSCVGMAGRAKPPHAGRRGRRPQTGGSAPQRRRVALGSVAGLKWVRRWGRKLVRFLRVGPPKWV